MMSYRTKCLHLLVTALLVVPHPVVPASITVDGTTGEVSDDGICTLPEAIDNANDDALTHDDCVAGAAGNDDITLTGNVTLTTVNNGPPGAGQGLPVITSEITLEGAGFQVSRDGASPAFRILQVNSTGDLTINNAIISGGLIENPMGSKGGGIWNRGGTLALNNSTLSGNTASAVSNDGVYGGGIYNTGSTTIVDSTVTGNVAQHLNVATAEPVWAAGGAISNCLSMCSGAGTLVLMNSTVDGNSAVAVAGNYSAFAYGAGLYNVEGGTTVTNSTFSGNVAYASDTSTGGPNAGAGAVFTVDADLFLVSSTLAGNEAQAPGGSYYSTTLDYFGFGQNPTIEIQNTILGGNLPAGYTCSPFVEAGFDLGGNLADDTSCATIPGTLTGLDTNLTDNGGPTETHAIMSGSSAIDNAGTCGQPFDQRGVARPADFCDSGSFEFVTCSAPQGEEFILPDGITSTEETFEACNSITVNDRDVMGPSGHLILRTAGVVRFNDGFAVLVDGQLTVDIDSGIMMPDHQ